MAADLLPPNATKFEQGLADSQARIQAIPTPVDQTVKPLEVPEAFLPFVGWGRSVDVWSREWPAARQRAVSESAPRLHRIKGTADAIRSYVVYAGGLVKDIERPPAKVFSGPSPSPEEREAWLRLLPQVRVWRIQERTVSTRFKAFHGGARHKAFAEGRFALPSTALSRLKRRARWIVDGLETETRVSEFGSYFRLHLKGQAGHGVFSGRLRLRGFFAPTTAAKRLLTIAPTPRLPWRSPVTPSLEPVTAEPEQVREQGVVGHSVFCGRPIGGFFQPSRAGNRIYDRYAINDGSRALRSPANQFWGFGRYNFPAHTARLQLSIPGRMSRYAAGQGFHTPKLKFWLPRDPSRVEAVRRAVQSAKRLSDKIVMVMGPEPGFVAGKRFLAGVDGFIVGRS